VGVGSYYVKEYYGTVPVDENGSAYFEAPSNVELYFIAVDETGKEVQRMGSVTQITTGEHVSCIGCHEDRLNAPTVDRKAMDRLKRPPDRIEPPSWGVGPIDYMKQVQPVWDRHCVKCHRAENLEGNVDMTADRTRFFCMSYDSLCMRDSANWGYFRDYTYVQYYFIGYGPSGVFPALESGSRVSRLTKLLEDGHGEVRLTPDEYDRIFVWIDANVPYYATWDMARPHTMGGRDPMGLKGGRNYEAAWASEVTAFLGRHKQKLTSASINYTRPELSRILLRSLAKSGGGWLPDDGATIFKSKEDAEYRQLLAALQAASEQLKEKPRMDLPAAQPIPQQRDFGRVY
jgi:hypothetical protein